MTPQRDWLLKSPLRARFILETAYWFNFDSYWIYDCVKWHKFTVCADILLEKGFLLISFWINFYFSNWPSKFTPYTDVTAKEKNCLVRMDIYFSISFSKNENTVSILNLEKWKIWCTVCFYFLYLQLPCTWTKICYNTR